LKKRSDARRSLVAASLCAALNFAALLLSHFAVADLGFTEIVRANAQIGVNPAPILITRPLFVFATVSMLDLYIPAAPLFLALVFADLFTDATTIITGAFHLSVLIVIIAVGATLWMRDLRRWFRGST
jgi:hypothetical protein